MITRYVITGTEWTQVSNIGESGSCWLSEDTASRNRGGDVRVFPSVLTPSVTKIDDGKRVYTPNSNSDVIFFDALLSSEVLWARCASVGMVAVLLVSVEG